MKKLILLMSVVALFTSPSFANATTFKKNVVFEKSVNSHYHEGQVSYFVKIVHANSLYGYSCSVTASWINSKDQKSSVTVNYNCGYCTTQQAACDIAYRLARLAIPS